MMRVLRWIRKWFFVRIWQNPHEKRRYLERRYYDQHPDGPLGG
jgi:hypothetical protein